MSISLNFNTPKKTIQLVTFLILLSSSFEVKSQTSDFDGLDGLSLTLSDGSLMTGATGLGMTGPAGAQGPQGPQGDPATADGNGIYTGDGTVPSNTTVTITDVLNFDGDIALSGQILGLSDERLKNNIAPIINALSSLSQLNPTTYNFDVTKYENLNLPTVKQYGLLAQAVEKVIPEIVSTTQFKGNQEFKSINYNALISILVGAINEQETRIKTLEEKMDKILKSLEIKE